MIVTSRSIRCLVAVGVAVVAATGRCGEDGRTAGPLSPGQSRAGVFGLEAPGQKFVYVFDHSASMGEPSGRPLAAAELGHHAPRLPERLSEPALFVCGEVVVLVGIREDEDRIRGEFQRRGDGLVVPRATIGIDRVDKPPDRPLGLVVSEDRPATVALGREDHEPLVVEDDVKLP